MRYTIRVGDGKEEGYEEVDILGGQQVVQELRVLIRLKKCYENEKIKGGY